ncbi:Pentatricopeptide repeat-containing protein [Camellia lanceoleosa]|uniref:Pentatricopeptide repeat-containing protein n=1 Tax=Camellia lanceoleosa TaxID=1840588 RepID=A0ACC0H2S2_9ERIC|nr:Pentatricopeptide repeat-containing protein [Camellia lanceoleosa]
MPRRNLVSWNAMITGYLHNDKVDKARELLDKMPLRKAFTWSLMMTCYSSNGELEKARELFNLFPDKMNPGIKTCHQCSRDCVIWEESIDEQPWEKARSISPFKVKEDDEVDNLDIKLKVRRKTKRVYSYLPPEVGLKISRSLKGLSLIFFAVCCLLSASYAILALLWLCFGLNLMLVLLLPLSLLCLWPCLWFAAVAYCLLLTEVKFCSRGVGTMPQSCLVCFDAGLVKF